MWWNLKNKIKINGNKKSIGDLIIYKFFDKYKFLFFPTLIYTFAVILELKIFLSYGTLIPITIETLTFSLILSLFLGPLIILSLVFGLLLPLAILLFIWGFYRLLETLNWIYIANILVTIIDLIVIFLIPTLFLLNSRNKNILKIVKDFLRKYHSFIYLFLFLFLLGGFFYLVFAPENLKIAFFKKYNRELGILLLSFLHLLIFFGYKNYKYELKENLMYLLTKDTYLGIILWSLTIRFCKFSKFLFSYRSSYGFLCKEDNIP